MFPRKLFSLLPCTFPPGMWVSPVSPGGLLEPFRVPGLLLCMAGMLSSALRLLEIPALIPANARMEIQQPGLSALLLLPGPGGYLGLKLCSSSTPWPWGRSGFPCHL